MNNAQKRQILWNALSEMEETFSSNEFMKFINPSMGSRKLNMIYGHRKFLLENCIRVNKKSWRKKETSGTVFPGTAVSVSTPELFPNTFKAKEERLLHDVSDLQKIQSEEEKVNEAVKLLKSKGYKILKPSFQEL